MRPSLVIAVAALIALAGCGANRPEQPTLAPALARELAARSDAVAKLAARHDTCGASREARRLQTAMHRAVASGEIRPEIASPLRRAVLRLTAALRCVPQPQPSPPPRIKENKGKHKGGKGDEEGDD